MNTPNPEISEQKVFVIINSNTQLPGSKLHLNVDAAILNDKGTVPHKTIIFELGGRTKKETTPDDGQLRGADLVFDYVEGVRTKLRAWAQGAEQQVSEYDVTPESYAESIRHSLENDYANKERAHNESITQLRGEVTRLERKLKRLGSLQGNEVALPVLTQINNLTLDKKLKEMIKQIMAQYNEAVLTAMEFDPELEPPSVEEVCQNLINAGVEMLKTVGKFQKPTLVIVPKTSFKEKIKAMAEKNKYTFPNFEFGNDSPFFAVKSPTKNFISIIDGNPGMPPTDEVTYRDEDRSEMRNVYYSNICIKDQINATYARRGLRSTNVHEFYVLLQASIRAFKTNCNIGAVVDSSTLTLLDDEFLTPAYRVACGGLSNSSTRNLPFADVHNNFEFSAYSFRGRPSYQFMEF